MVQPSYFYVFLTGNVIYTLLQYVYKYCCRILGIRMKEMLNEIKKGFFKKKYFTIRLVMVIGALILMGFSLSWLILVDMGMDPCTLMNIAIADALGWSLGNWQAFLNLSLFIVVLICGAKNIGFGTIANIFLVGYSVDFFSWIWSRPECRINDLWN